MGSAHAAPYATPKTTIGNPIFPSSIVFPKRKSTLRASSGIIATVAPEIKSLLMNLIERYAAAHPIAVQTKPIINGESELLESIASKASRRTAKANKAPLIIVITDCRSIGGVVCR